MTATARTTRTRLPAALIPVLAAAVLVAGALPAAAHAVLTGSSPPADATVDEALDEVVLEFNEEVGMPRVAVADPDGEPVTDGAPVEEGDRIVQPLGDLAVAGTYTVAYRVVSDDGHPVEGEFEFAYEGPLTGERDDEPVVEEPTSPAGTAVDEEEAPDTEEVAPATEPAETAAQQPADGGGVVLLVVALGLLAALAVAGWFALRRRPGA